MSNILIFGFDQYYPQGGLDDMRAILDSTTPGVLDEKGYVTRDTMRAFFEHKGEHEKYQIAYFAADGSTLKIDYWERCGQEPTAVSEGPRSEPLMVTRYGEAEYFRLVRTDVRNSAVSICFHL